MTRGDDGYPENIALWGPPGSGKTWLIRAFSKELELYNQKDVDFDYVLIDEDTQTLVRADAPIQAGSKDFEDHLLRFTRKPKPGKKGPKYEVCNQSHLINIRDLPGGWTIDVINDPEKYDAALQGFLNSKYIVAVFDHSLKSGESAPVEAEYNPGKASSFDPSENSRDTYALWFTKFLELLSQNDAQPSQRFVALTLSKIDKLTWRRAPEEILATKFGPNIRHLMNKYLYRQGVDISRLPVVLNVFSTTSAGYYGPHTPNIDEDGNIKKIDKWMPRNTAAPFFWIFETIERQRIARVSEHYVGYPSINIL